MRSKEGRGRTRRAADGGTSKGRGMEKGAKKKSKRHTHCNVSIEARPSPFKPVDGGKNMPRARQALQELLGGLIKVWCKVGGAYISISARTVCSCKGYANREEQEQS